MPSRKTAAWQQQLDDRILEHIAEERWSSPTVLASLADIQASENRIAERCQMLHYAGLIDSLHDDMYELTQWGQLYLRGELDAAHQPVPTVERLRWG